MVSAIQRAANRNQWNANVDAVWLTANALACWQALIQACACNVNPPIPPVDIQGFAAQTLSGVKKIVKARASSAGINDVNSVGASCAVVLPGSSFEAPMGTIVMWGGTLATIPVNWHLCDGTMGTPDLRSRFIRGAPPAVEPGSTGGSDLQNHGAGTLLPSAHAGSAVSAHAGSAVAAHGAISGHAGTAVTPHAGSAVADHAALAGHAHGPGTLAADASGLNDLVTAGIIGTGSAVAHVHTISGSSESVSGGTPNPHAVTQPDNHVVTQPNNHDPISPHVVTQPDNHVVTQPAPHTMAGVTADADNRPAYFELAFIQRVA